jgi:hypothetical protein
MVGDMKKISLFLCVLFLFVSGSVILKAEEDPLRGTELRKHLTGPEIEPGSLKGKVVFFEYWGYR